MLVVLDPRNIQWFSYQQEPTEMALFSEEKVEVPYTRQSLQDIAKWSWEQRSRAPYLGFYQNDQLIGWYRSWAVSPGDIVLLAQVVKPGKLDLVEAILAEVELV